MAFERTEGLPIGGTPYALGMWVYGDGSGHTLRVWVRDAEGEVFQYGLGTVGGAGWLFRTVPLGGLIDPGNIVRCGGNKRVDYPISVDALILDDAPDSAIGGGTIYVDDLTAIDGREAYSMRLSRGDAEGAVVAKLQAGVLASVKRCTGAWCHIAGNGFDGWAVQEQLWGVYPNEKVE